MSNSNSPEDGKILLSYRDAQSQMCNTVEADGLIGELLHLASMSKLHVTSSPSKPAPKALLILGFIVYRYVAGANSPSYAG